jgi:dipeptidyl aminopeptidase/acylaminoacyl peptidase
VTPTAIALCLIAFLVSSICPSSSAPANPESQEPNAAGLNQTPRAIPGDVEKRPVVIWSDGTRMAGDLYLPKELDSGARLPAVVFCNGTGGTKDGTGAKLGPLFARSGFVFLSFDYRGWGKSDSRLMLVGPMPKPDADGEVTVRAKPIRWQMDYGDQTYDIGSAVSFLCGEKNVDPARIGIMGSSYGGGLVTWVAGNDPRVKCLVAQVPGMGHGQSPDALKHSYELATKQARGEVEPIPMETGKLGGKMSRFSQMRVNPVKTIGFSAIGAAEKINIPTLIVVAENDELVDNDANGGKVFKLLEAKGNVATAYHVIKGCTHFDVYNRFQSEATDLELKWYHDHL